MPKVDRKLNIVITVEREEGNIFIHSTPIGREVFERFFMVMSRASAAIWMAGLSVTMGPRVAALQLKKTAEQMQIWENSPDGSVGVEHGLMAEIRRLTNVFAPGDNGWSMLPLEMAVSRDMLTEDEIAEVEGELVFFTLESCLRKKSQLPAFLASMAKWSGSQITSLSTTEYRDSLPTSTKAATSGEKAKRSSIPR